MTEQTPARRAAARLRVAAEPASLAPIRRFVADEAITRGAARNSADDLVQAVDELVTNVIKHGYRGSQGDLEVEIEEADGAVVIRIRDHAVPFNPTGLAATHLDLPLSKRPLGGMGIHLARELTDEFTHSTPPGWGNQVTLVKHMRSTQEDKGDGRIDSRG